MRVNTEVAMSHGLFLPNLFQLAYQTKDIEAAKRALEIHFGARTWQYSPVNEAAPGVTMADAKTWVGDIMIQVQQVTRSPEASRKEVFWESPAPEPGQLMRLHHIAHMVYQDSDWEHILSEIDRNKFEIVFQGRYGDILKYLYIDTRHILGHYLEYIHCLPDGVAFFNESREKIAGM